MTDAAESAGRDEPARPAEGGPGFGASADAMASLRAATSHGHRQVDRLVSARLRDLTVAGYADLLTDLARVHLALEPELRDHAPIAPRPVAELLAADLDALGRGLPVPGGPSGIVGSESAALGALYVVEGSAAGGMVVASLVRRRLGPGAPVSFLERSGGDEDWWDRFGGRVRRAHRDGADLEVAVGAAQATFARFAAALDVSRRSELVAARPPRRP